MEVIREFTMMTNILKKFIDAMPLKWPKTLPLHRGIDHHIKLELGVKSLMRPPYRMAPLELVELKKQLDKLLSGSIIYSFKASFETLVIFQKK